MNQIFNLDKALEITDNDFDLLQEIIQIFKSEKVTMLTNINNALKSENLKLIKSSAHSIKGTLVSIGADVCADIASKIECTKTDGNITDSKILFENLKIEIEKYLVESKEKLRTVQQ